MNLKRGLLAFIAAFILIFLFEFVWHGMLMKNAYMETAGLWRSESEMQSRFGMLLLGQVVIAFAFTALYVTRIGTSGAASGACYGVMIGILVGGSEFIRFAVQPLTTTILWMSIFGALIELAIAGAIIGAIYRPSLEAERS